MAHSFFEHLDATALADSCAARIAQALDEALATRGSAVLALAGGRTSPPIFRRLAAMRREWSSVTVMPSDERWVPADHADCNLRQMREAFAAASGIRWLALVPDAPEGSPDASFAKAALSKHAGPFDTTLLGMGADGHFGSLFPGAPTLPRALDPSGPEAAVAIVPEPMPSAGPYPRVSLTLSRMLNSRLVLLAITGDEKLTVLKRAQRDADPLQLPIAALMHARATIEVHWSPS